MANGIMVYEPFEENVVESMVPVPPNSFTHTAAAGQILAIGIHKVHGVPVCLIALSSPTRFHWVEYVDGIHVDANNPMPSAMDPGYLMFRL